MEKVIRFIRKYIEQGKYINICHSEKRFTFNVHINEKDSAEIDFDMEENIISVEFWYSPFGGYYKKVGKLSEKHEFDNKDKIIINNLVLEVEENNEVIGRLLFNHYLLKEDSEISSIDELEGDED